MERCVQCGNRDLTKTSEQLPYNDVALVEGDVCKCKECGACYEAFARVEELSQKVAHHIAHKEERLTPSEVRFLRTYVSYASKELAHFLDATPERVSRWESKTSPMVMSLPTEKLLRFMVLNDRPVTAYGLDRAGSRAKTTVKPLFRQRSGDWRAQG